jgi:GTP cyclohydrolase FolE2
LPKPSTLPLAVELARLAGETHRAEYLDRVTDIPAASPRQRLPLAGAGVARLPVEIRVASLLDGPARLTGELSLETPLVAERRGVHMSRFVEVAASLIDGKWQNLEEVAERGVLLAAERQEVDAADLGFSATTIVWREAAVSGRRSPDPFRVGVEATLRDGAVTTMLSLAASVMTACPCTAAYSHHSARLDLADGYGAELADAVMRGVLTYTHSQRAEVLVKVEASVGFGLRECLAALSEATTMTGELLKRPDEHELVRRAHERPQFTEDVVRDTAAALASRAPKNAARSTMTITARAIESIHAHDVSARYEGRIEDVREALRA